MVICDICGTQYSSLTQLAKHLFMHMRDVPYFCTKCVVYLTENLQKTYYVNYTAFISENGPSAPTPSNLFKTRSHLCGDCGCSFLYFKDKMMHMCKGKMPALYRCDICPISFPWSPAGKVHSHLSDFSNYHCEMCFALFTCRCQDHIHEPLLFYNLEEYLIEESDVTAKDKVFTEFRLFFTITTLLNTVNLHSTTLRFSNQTCSMEGLWSSSKPAINNDGSVPDGEVLVSDKTESGQSKATERKSTQGATRVAGEFCTAVSPRKKATVKDCSSTTLPRDSSGLQSINLNGNSSKRIYADHIYQKTTTTVKSVSVTCSNKKNSALATSPKASLLSSNVERKNKNHVCHPTLEDRTQSTCRIGNRKVVKKLKPPKGTAKSLPGEHVNDLNSGSSADVVSRNLSFDGYTIGRFGYTKLPEAGTSAPSKINSQKVKQKKKKDTPKHGVSKELRCKALPNLRMIICKKSRHAKLLKHSTKPNVRKTVSATREHHLADLCNLQSFLSLQEQQNVTTSLTAHSNVQQSIRCAVGELDTIKIPTNNVDSVQRGAEIVRDMQSESNDKLRINPNGITHLTNFESTNPGGLKPIQHMTAAAEIPKSKEIVFVDLTKDDDLSVECSNQLGNDFENPSTTQNNTIPVSEVQLKNVENFKKVQNKASMQMCQLNSTKNSKPAHCHAIPVECPQSNGFENSSAAHNNVPARSSLPGQEIPVEIQSNNSIKNSGIDQNNVPARKPDQVTPAESPRSSNGIEISSTDQYAAPSRSPLSDQVIPVKILQSNNSIEKSSIDQNNIHTRRSDLVTHVKSLKSINAIENSSIDRSNIPARSLSSNDVIENSSVDQCALPSRTFLPDQVMHVKILQSINSIENSSIDQNNVLARRPDEVTLAENLQFDNGTENSSTVQNCVPTKSPLPDEVIPVRSLQSINRIENSRIGQNNLPSRSKHATPIKGLQYYNIIKNSSADQNKVPKRSPLADQVMPFESLQSNNAIENSSAAQNVASRSQLTENIANYYTVPINNVQLKDKGDLHANENNVITTKSYEFNNTDSSRTAHHNLIPVENLLSDSVENSSTDQNIESTRGSLPDQVLSVESPQSNNSIENSGIDQCNVPSGSQLVRTLESLRTKYTIKIPACSISKNNGLKTDLNSAVLSKNFQPEPSHYIVIPVKILQAKNTADSNKNSVFAESPLCEVAAGTEAEKADTVSVSNMQSTSIEDIIDPNFVESAIHSSPTADSRADQCSVKDSHSENVEDSNKHQNNMLPSRDINSDEHFSNHRLEGEKLEELKNVYNLKNLSVALHRLPSVICNKYCPVKVDVIKCENRTKKVSVVLTKLPSYVRGYRSYKVYKRSQNRKLALLEKQKLASAEGNNVDESSSLLTAIPTKDDGLVNSNPLVKCRTLSSSSEKSSTGYCTVSSLLSNSYELAEFPSPLLSIHESSVINENPLEPQLSAASTELPLPVSSISECSEMVENRIEFESSIGDHQSSFALNESPPLMFSISDCPVNIEDPVKPQSSSHFHQESVIPIEFMCLSSNHHVNVPKKAENPLIPQSVRNSFYSPVIPSSLLHDISDHQNGTSFSGSDILKTSSDLPVTTSRCSDDIQKPPEISELENFPHWKTRDQLQYLRHRIAHINETLEEVKEYRQKVKYLEPRVLLTKLPDTFYEKHLKSKPIMLSNILPMITKVESLSCES